MRISPALAQAKINIDSIQSYTLPTQEPWALTPPPPPQKKKKKKKIILDLHKNKKFEVDSSFFKSDFLEIRSKFKHHLSIYTGGSKQDVKVSCAVIFPNFLDSIRLPDNSSIFTAEAKAIDIAFYHIRNQEEKQLIVFSDSLFVLKLLKNLNHSNPLIQQILPKYFYLSTSKEIIFCWLPSHINIRGKEIADQEAKAALLSPILNFKIPHSDY